VQSPPQRFKFFAAILKAPGLFSGFLALALRRRPMATMIACVETREVLRCEYCRLTQYRTSNSLCRRCHKPLDLEEPEPFAPQAIPGLVESDGEEAGSQVAGRVLEIRRARHLSQRQLAARMEVPRTYISKIENGKAIPTLGSLERLACALDVEVGQLVRDARSRREELVASVFADPLLAEIAACLPRLNSLQRSLVLSAARDAAMGRRRSA
jgi:transcriptional regulator with XRE-family HTH domain